MSVRLSVSTDGLHAASAALNERAGELTAATGETPAGNKPSSIGAASFAAAIEAFSAAYADRIAGHGHSVHVAAASYASTDDDEAADISAVST